MNLDLDITSLTQTIVSCAAYARHDLEDTCYLKCDDGSKCMKSECVSQLAPDCVPHDWLWKWMQEEG